MRNALGQPHLLRQHDSLDNRLVGRKTKLLDPAEKFKLHAPLGEELVERRDDAVGCVLRQRLDGRRQEPVALEGRERPRQ